jgi:hypothetical protein
MSLVNFWRRVQTPDGDPAEFAALADRSLSPRRLAAVERRVAGSPELAEMLARAATLVGARAGGYRLRHGSGNPAGAT